MLPIHTHAQQTLSPYPTLLNQLNRIFAQIAKIQKAVFILLSPFIQIKDRLPEISLKSL